MYKFGSFKGLLYVLLLLLAFCLNFYTDLQEFPMRYKLRHTPIVVTLSTTPYRVSDIEPTLRSILRQNMRIDAIYLAIPYIFKRDNIPYYIPQWLEHEPRIKIVRTKDYGPATKLLGVLKNVQLDPNTIIITLDDDIKYPKNTVLQLAYSAAQYPGRAIGLAGKDPKYDEHGVLISNALGGFSHVLADGAKATILQGCAGIAYRRNFFSEDVFSILDTPRECINSDDVYLSFYLARKNIDRLVLNNKFMHRDKIDFGNDLGHGTDALHKLTPSPSDKHRICIAYLKETYPNVRF